MRLPCTPFSRSDRQTVSLHALFPQNIQQNRHCILVGPTGTGKSRVLEKVVRNNAKIIFKDRVEFWMTTSTTAKEVEELIVEAMKRRVKPYKILLVLYNLDCNNIFHLELARSLCEGRNIYISNQKRWIELTDLTVCIETSSKMKDNTPELLTALVSKVTKPAPPIMSPNPILHHDIGKCHLSGGQLGRAGATHQ